MKYNSYEQSVIASNGNAMSTSGNSAHFPMESSSGVIKTAPPGHHRQQHQGFSPKHEPIDLTPLTQPPSLQDLSKMQPSVDHYSYMPAASVSAADYSRVYDYMAGVAGYQMASPQVFPSAAAVAATNIIQQHHHQQQQQQQQQQDWRGLEHPYITYQRTTSSSTNGQIHYAGPHNSHPQQQQQAQQSAIGALVIVDGLSQQHQHQQLHEHRLYKALNGELLSPVDSGISADLSMLESQPPFALVASSIIQSQQQQQPSSVIATHSQHTSSASTNAADIERTVMEYRRETASSTNSHHAREPIDTPVIIPKLYVSMIASVNGEKRRDLLQGECFWISIRPRGADLYINKTGG